VSDAARQSLLVQTEANGVVCDVGEIHEPVAEAKHEEDCGVDPKGNGWVAPFDPCQCSLGDKGALCNHSNRETTSKSGDPDIPPQLTQRLPHRARQSRLSPWHKSQYLAS
jgi:hypothetical protein